MAFSYSFFLQLSSIAMMVDGRQYSTARQINETIEYFFPLLMLQVEACWAGELRVKVCISEPDSDTTLLPRMDLA